MKDEEDNKIKILKDENEKLQAEIKGKKIQSELDRLTVELTDWKNQVTNLKKENIKLKEKTKPWWKRRVQ